MPRWESELHTAARSGRLDLVKVLTTAENINSKSSWGYTAFNCACYGGHLDVMKFLVEEGADMKMCNGDGWTPLHAACLRGHKSAVEFLLDNGARDCIHVCSATTPTPLNVVTRSHLVKDGDILKLLLKAGADVNSRNPYGRTPLAEAALGGVESKVQTLLEAGANVNDVDSHGQSVFSIALRSPKIVRILLDMDRGFVAFDRATYHYKTLEVLLEYGVDADVPCSRHKKCDGSSMMCWYQVCRLRRDKFAVECFESYFNKMQVARLYPGRKNTLVDPPVDGIDWDVEKRIAFRGKCKAELTKLNTEKVRGTSATYLDVLYQRPSALKQVEFLPYDELQPEFPIYGGLVRCKFVTGRRRLPLLEQSTDFFELSSDPIPYLPLECVTEILSYLPVQDLQKIATICAPRGNNLSAQPPNRKRPNDDSPLQVTKHAKVP